jgi:integrase
VKKSAEGYWTGNPYKRPGSPFWHFVYRDAAGVVRRRSAKTKDLRIARERLAEALQAVEKQKAGHIDRYVQTRKQPLEELVVAYKEHLVAERRTDHHVRTAARHLRAFIAFAKASTIPSITRVDAERFAEQLRVTRSAKTRDNYAGSLRAFGAWLMRTGRWDVDPFAGLSTRTCTKDKDRVYRRMSFRFEEAERLVAAVWARHEADAPRGGRPAHRHHSEHVRDRQVLYWFALTTAFRANECASLRWEDVTVDGPKLAVRLAGQFTKNGNDALIPLQAFMAEALKDMRKRRSARQVADGEGPVRETDPVFHVPQMIARLVRKDAQFAGLIPQRSPTTRRVDFHCLRKSCARILIELNVHPRIIQDTLRHADIRTTMSIYGEIGEDDLFRELPGKFPVPQSLAAPSVAEAPTTTSARLG